MSIVRSISRISYLPFVGFVSAYGAYNASLKILNDENAAWNELDVEQALKQNFKCSLLVVILEMAIFFAFFRAVVVYYAWMWLRDNEDIQRGIKAGAQLKRSPPAAVAAPVSTKDPVAMASPARFSANVHETMPGPQATKDPNAVTAMKSLTGTENPGAKKSTGQASSKLITSSSELSTVKTPTESPEIDRGSPRNPSEMISSSSEFSIMKTTTGSPEKDRKSPRNPVAPDLASKHSKEASQKAGRNEIQISASFKTEAAAVNGDDTENSPRVDLPSKATAGPEVPNKVPHPSAQRPACNKIDQEVETALCRPDNQKTPRLQVKVTSYPDRKITFAYARTQKEQEQVEREKIASPSRSRVSPFCIPPRTNYRSNMEKYRTLQRSENFATSTAKEELASHGSPTVSEVLSATNPVTVSSPRKSKSPLDVSRMNVENIHLMKQIETCKQEDEAADQKKDFPGVNQLGIEKIPDETKKNEVYKQAVFSDTKVGSVGSQSILTELKKVIFDKKKTIDVKSVTKMKTQPDETSVLVDLVQTMDTQEEIKSDADEWKAFFSEESDREKSPGDVGKQMAQKTSAKTSLYTSRKTSTKTSPNLSPRVSPKMSLQTSSKRSPMVSPKISVKTPLNASPKISSKTSPKTSLDATPKASPKTSLETSPIASPKTLPKTVPNTSPKTSLKTSLNTSPKTSLKSSPKVSPKTSPIASLKTSSTGSLNVSPKRSPITSPKTSPQTSPKTSLIVAPKTSLMASMKKSTNTSPKTSLKSSTKASPKTSKMAPLKTSPKTSPMVSPKTSLIASPKASPKTSLNRSPKTSPTPSSKTSPKTSPLVSPKTSPMGSPKTSLVASPKTSLNTPLKTSPIVSPRTSLKSSPKASPETSPKISLMASPKTSPISSSKTTPKTSPIASPKISPKTSLMASVKTSPIVSPKTTPKTSPISSPKTSPQTSPKSSLLALPKTSLNTSPETSSNMSPMASLKTSPKSSPKASPKMSRMAPMKTSPTPSPMTSPNASQKTSPMASPKTSPIASPKTSPIASLKTSLNTPLKTSPTLSPKTSLKTSPKASPKTSPIVSPKTSPIVSPKTSPIVSPKTSPKALPKTSLNTSPKTSPTPSPKTSLKTSLKASPKTSPMPSPNTSLKTSPNPSPNASPKTSPKTSPLASQKTSPKPVPGRKTGARKSGIPPCRSIRARKLKNDPICPAQEEETPGQVDKKNEHVKCNQKPRAERINDMEKKTTKRNSQSPSSFGAEQSCFSRIEHKDSEKQTVKRRRLPLPSEATPLKLYGPWFFRIHKQIPKRDHARKAKYQTKLDAIPEEPEEIDTKWDQPRRNFVQEWEEYCKGVFERFAEMDRFYQEREAKRAERMAKIVEESENPQLLYEMGLIPQALYLETKPVAEKIDEKPNERFLKRRERPPKTDPKVLEEINKLCAEEGIVLSTEGTWSTNPFLADVSEEEEDEILEWLEKEMNKNSRRSSSSLYSQYNWPISK